MSYRVSVWTLAFGELGTNDLLFEHYPEFKLLKDYLADRGITIHTIDILPAKDADIVLYLNIPEVDLEGYQKSQSIAVLYECEVIHPHSWKKSSLEKMSEVLTYHTKLDHPASMCRVWPQAFEAAPLKRFVHRNFEEKTKLCVLVAGKKHVEHPLELYSKRIEAIRWFEDHHPNDFDLYGRGWENDEVIVPSILKRIIRKLGFKITMKRLPFTSYKGEIAGPPGSPDKIATMSKYKFSICYENATIPGYVTEKIFDSMFASCVPVYWGANDISDFVSESCYIDFRNFDCDLKKLYTFLSTIKPEIYNQYIANIENYLLSEKFKKFSYEQFASDLLNKIQKTLRN